MESHPPAQRLSPSVSRSPLPARTAVLLHAALAACALLAACANTVNNHGGAVGSGGSASSGGTNTIQTTGGTSGSGGTAPEIVLGADAESYPVAERSDYAAATGSSTAGSSGLGYITVTPLPDILYTETQSGIPATWTRYEVTITIQGTPFTLSFTKGDTAAKVIENVPTGSTVSARARISVASTTPTAALDYELTASSASSTTTAGSNTIMMWVHYPVEFVGGGSVTVPAASTYSNGGGNPALALPDPAETDGGIFAGWALSPDGPAAFAPGSAIPAGSYRGRLTLYPWYWGDFTVQETAPESARQTDSTDTGAAYTIRSITDAFTLSAVAGAGGSIPAGTSFSWTISAADTGRTVTKTGATCTVRPSELGLSEAVFAATEETAVAVSCTASNSASSTGIARQRSLLLSMSQTPDFSISITPPDSYNAANSDTTGTVPTYALMDLTGSFTITATPAEGRSFLPGTEFTWTVYGTTLTGATQKGASVSLSPSAMGLTSTAGQTSSISTSRTSPTTISVSCTAKNDDAVVTSKDADDASVKVFLLTIPDFTIKASAGSGLKESPSSNASRRVFLVSEAGDLSKSISFTATAKTGEPDFPEGTTFSWVFSPTNEPTSTEPTISQSVNVFATAVPSDPSDLATYTVYCTAQFTGLTDVGPRDLQFDLKKPVKLPAPTAASRLEETTDGVGGRGTATNSSNAYTFARRGNDCSKINIKLEWRWSDSSPSSIPAGKSVKYKVYAGSTLLSTTTSTDYYATYYQMGGRYFGTACNIKVIAFVDGVSDPQESEPLVFTVTVN